MSQPSDLEWTATGAPRSHRFDDIYFSPVDGLAESRAVFLEGCGLPDAWRARNRFTVAELGFGAGLNILALLQLWRRERPERARLHVFSVEAHPLTRADAARAIAPWPELAELGRPLLARWPTARGMSRIEWPDLGATLDVCVAEVEEALTSWDGHADAWFLDGFSPARNPDMWRDAVLAAVAERSAPGARVATFTAAGSVRRGLAAAGFAVERRPGHAGKRHRLEARLERIVAPGESARPKRRDLTDEIVIVGAGIAAASLVRALAAQGRSAIFVAGEDRGASGGPAALVTPRLHKGYGADARLSAQAYRRAVDVYEAYGETAILGRGVQRYGAPADLAVLIASGSSALHEPDEFGGVETAGQDPSVDPAASLLMRRALVLDPRQVVDAWLGSAKRITRTVDRMEREGGRWRLLDPAGELIVTTSDVVLAGGYGVGRLLPTLPLRAVRGQISVAAGVSGPNATWGGYCMTVANGLAFGGTHDRDVTTDELRPADHGRNLATLSAMLPRLAERCAGGALQGWAAVRAATPDHLPIVGPVPNSPGLWVLSGLGSRGFTTAPLLAEHLAAWLTGAPSPLPLDLGDLVAPVRHQRRAARRAGRLPTGVSSLSLDRSNSVEV